MTHQMYTCFYRIRNAVIGLCTVLAASVCVADDMDTFNLQQIADGIYVHKGVHQQPVAINKGDIANIGFIVGDTCVAVVDPGGSVSVARQLKRELRNITQLPVCYVILSHIHGDHLLGASVFAEENTKFIGHENLPDAIWSNKDFFIKQFVTPYGESADDKYFVIPKVLVAQGQDLTIDLGARELSIVAYEKAHTTTDLTIYDKKSDTLWLSDLLFMERIPPLDGSLKGWISVMERLQKTSVDRVVPGHGPVSASWPEAMQAQQQYFTKLVNETRSLIEEGGFLEEAIENVGYSEKNNWMLFDEVHKRNVTRAFAELEWE